MQSFHDKSVIDVTSKRHHPRRHTSTDRHRHRHLHLANSTSVSISTRLDFSSNADLRRNSLIHGYYGFLGGSITKIFCVCDCTFFVFMLSLDYFSHLLATGNGGWVNSMGYLRYLGSFDRSMVMIMVADDGWMESGFGGSGFGERASDRYWSFRAQEKIWTVGC